MMSRNLNPADFPASEEHGNVIRATREWGCSEWGYEYWETWLKYEDGHVEYTDFTRGDTYDY